MLMRHTPDLNRVIGLIALNLLPASALADSCAPVGNMESTIGRVEIRRAATTTWELATATAALCERDQVRTGDQSKASVRLANETLVNLGNNTTLNLPQVEATGQSVLDLVRGIIHSLSRVPKTLEIHTPFVNAAIEGTEFVVRSDETGADVSVIEGVVRTYNEHGDVTLHKNEAAFAAPNQKPVKRLEIDPVEAVKWVINYPVVLDFGNATLSSAESAANEALRANQPETALEALETAPTSRISTLLRASALLMSGNPDQAASVLESEQSVSAESLALRSTASLAMNQLEHASDLADAATLHDPSSSAGWLARSYVAQARSDIISALKDAENATKRSPRSGLAFARFSEVLLMQGKSDEALTQAKRAAELSPTLDRSHEALGFAFLNLKKTAASLEEFDKALTLNPRNAKSRLGSGLASIHQGDLRVGREKLESAVLLAPTDALFRSYLGKAYFEENRAKVSHDQLDLAKELDPQDPTGWFYEAVLLNSENRPVEALTSMEQAIAKNDNRAVYRSRLLLDDDTASRQTGLGALYQTLNFEQLATPLAARSLAAAPANAAAHRFLADSYLGQYQHNISRVNELRQAELFGKIGQQIVQPQLYRLQTALLDDGGPASLGFNEFNSLMRDSGPYANISVSAGGRATVGGDLTTGWISDDYAIHASQYHLETNGFAKDKDFSQDSGALKLQWQTTGRLRLGVNASSDESNKGNAGLRYSDLFSTQSLRINDASERYSLDAVYDFSERTRLIAMSSQTKREQTTRYTYQYTPDAVQLWTVGTDRTEESHHLMFQRETEGNTVLAGTQRTATDNNSTHALSEQATNCVFPGCAFSRLGNTRMNEQRTYAYWLTDFLDHQLTLTTGIEFVEQNRGNTNLQISKHETLPKIGLNWSISPATEVSTAAFRSLNSIIDASEYLSLAPTQIAGFDQLFSGQRQGLSDNMGLAIEHQASASIRIGAKYLENRTTAPITETYLDTGDLISLTYRTTDVETTNQHGVAWLYWTPTPSWSLGLEYRDHQFNDEQERLLNNSGDNVESLHTKTVPLTLTWHTRNGLSAALSHTFLRQDGIFWAPQTTTQTSDGFKGNASHEVTDLTLSYRLPNRLGSISIGVKNLFDEALQFEDMGSYVILQPNHTGVPSSYAQERLVFGNVTLSF